MVKWLESTYDGLEQSGRSIHIMVAKHGASDYLPTFHECAIKIAQFCSSMSNYIYIYTMPYFEHMGYIYIYKYIYHPGTWNWSANLSTTFITAEARSPRSSWELNTAWAGCQSFNMSAIWRTKMSGNMRFCKQDLTIQGGAPVR